MATGALHVLALLLLVASGAKLGRPARAVDALHQAGLPASSALVRVLAAGEAGVAVLVLVVGGPGPALALSALYVGFALFVVRLRSVTGAAASCGCFGGADAPADQLHVVANLASAAVALAAAATGSRALVPVLQDQPALGVPYLLLLAVAAQALLLVLTGLPRLLAADRLAG